MMNHMSEQKETERNLTTPLNHDFIYIKKTFYTQELNTLILKLWSPLKFVKYLFSLIENNEFSADPLGRVYNLLNTV